MKITEFWVVTYPRENSEYGDIIFFSTVEGFVRQVKGGLNSSEVEGFYSTLTEAKMVAESLLNNK